MTYTFFDFFQSLGSYLHDIIYSLKKLHFTLEEINSLEVCEAVYYHRKYIDDKEANEWFLAGLQATDKKFKSNYDKFISDRNSRKRKATLREQLSKELGYKEEIKEVKPLIHSGKKVVRKNFSTKAG